MLVPRPPRPPKLACLLMLFKNSTLLPRAAMTPAPDRLAAPCIAAMACSLARVVKAPKGLRMWCSCMPCLHPCCAVSVCNVPLLRYTLIMQLTLALRRFAAGTYVGAIDNHPHNVRLSMIGVAIIPNIRALSTITAGTAAFGRTTLTCKRPCCHLHLRQTCIQGMHA